LLSDSREDKRKYTTEDWNSSHGIKLYRCSKISATAISLPSPHADSKGAQVCFYFTAGRSAEPLK